jgi:hypothetical protein
MYISTVFRKKQALFSEKRKIFYFFLRRP